MSNIFRKEQDSRESGVVLSFPIRQRPCGEKPVKRLEVFSLFELAKDISSFRQTMSVQEVNALDFLVAITSLEGALKKFRIEQPVFGLALDNAYQVIEAINEVLADFYETPERKTFKENVLEGQVHTWRVFSVKNKLAEFEHVFSAVCRKTETYFVEKKLGFDTSLLLHHAEENIHESIRGFVSNDALDEIRSAGRCFAVENFTASGFHVLRALEVVMADYYKAVSNEDKTFRSWHDYIEEFTALEKSRKERNSNYPSQKVSAMLDRMRQLDRNPLMHPRDTLDEMSADTLFKLGIVTITELAKDMRELAGQTEMKLVVSNDQEVA